MDHRWRRQHNLRSCPCTQLLNPTIWDDIWGAQPAVWNQCCTLSVDKPNRAVQGRCERSQGRFWIVDCSFSSMQGKTALCRPLRYKLALCGRVQARVFGDSPPWPEHDIWLTFLQSPSLQYQILSPCDLLCPKDPRQHPWLTGTQIEFWPFAAWGQAVKWTIQNCPERQMY